MAVGAFSVFFGDYVGKFFKSVSKHFNFNVAAAEAFESEFKYILKGVLDKPKAFWNIRSWVKAWEFLFDGARIRTNTNVLDGVSTAIRRGVKNIDDVVNYANHPAISSKTVKHIFRGDSGGGRHHISAILNDNSRKLVNRVSETQEGFYGAVFSSGGRKSFWPDSWDEFRVMDELKYVLNNNPTNVSGNRWQATTQGGQLIEYYLHADGHIISAFPVLPDFP